MTTGTVYRPASRDDHGDPVDVDGNLVRLHGDDSVAKVGTITGLIIGARSVEALPRGDVVSTDGLIGVPTHSPIQLQAGDILEVDGSRYAISGPRLWGRPHSLTGSPARYSWIKATAN